MGWLKTLLRGRDRTEALPLYDAVVARAREPHWYLEGAVPDTLDGRFDMVTAVLAMVLLRLERDAGEAGAEVGEGAVATTMLTERFVDDMDAQIRQIGFGDMVVGKHVGRMMGMLGGRLGAYREGLAEGTLGAALVRNLYRGEAPAEAALAHVVNGLTALRARLEPVAVDALVEGRLP